ncbi:putative MFS drug efflux [Diplogelasinospora grovesii]|uniref:MFS drug efflux n=1 Tax=Diplogelasinospora grovesii TaxID=303347 RepID=A0AAN6N1C6_9PEZI|nr:putative MFS drug efflux [Diplogelasinospora grovesii]
MADTESKANPTIADMSISDDSKTKHKVAGPNEDGNTTDNVDNEKAHGFVWLLIVASILMANFLFATDNTIAANVQPAVVKDFESLDKLAWLGVAFLASSWGTNFFWGDLYARFSSKWTFCSSFIVFAVGCTVAGAAPTIDALIVGRAICGVGGAGMYFGSMALLTQMTSERERPLYLNLVGITFGAGTVLGPIIGGAFAASSATWRWAFYFNLIVGGVCAPVYIFLLPTLNPRPGQTIIERAKEIDFLGIILVIGLIVSIVMAISFGGVEYAWNSGQVIALFVLAFVLLWVFLAQQHFAIGTTVERRMFPLHFLKSGTMIVLFLEVACCATCVFVPVYFLPLYFQFVKADSPILAGVRMLPYVAFQTVISILSGWLVGKTGYYVPWYIFAGALCIPGSALLYTVNQYTPLANVYGYEILLGLGSGAATQLTFAIASIKVAPEDIGRSTGWEAFAQLGGPTISLGMAQAIFLNKARAAIASLLPDLNAAEISTIISDPNNPLLRNQPQDVQNQVVDAVVRSMSNAYIVCLVGGCLVLLLIFRFKVNDRLWG